MGIDRESGEVSLDLMRKQTGATSIADTLRHAVEQFLQNKKAEKALEQMKNPAKTLNPVEIPAQFASLFQEDNIDLKSGAKKNSAEQQGRQNGGKETLKTYLNMVTQNGWENISDKTVKDQIQKVLTDYIIGHPGLMAYLKLNPSDPSTRVSVETIAAQILSYRADDGSRPLNDRLMSNIADMLATGKIDYTKLHELFNRQREEERQSDELTKKIASKNKEIEALKTTVDRFKKTTNTKTGNEKAVGAIAKSIETLQVEIDSGENKLAIAKSSIEETNDMAISIIQAKGKFTCANPDGGADLEASDASSLATLRAALRKAQLDANREIAMKRQKLEQLEAYETKTKEDLSAKEQELQTLKTQQEALNSTMTQTNSDTANEQKNITEKENELVDKINGLLGNSLIDVFLETGETVSAQKGEIMKTLEEDVYKRGRDTLDKTIYDKNKKKIKKDKIKIELDSLLKHGVAGYGKEKLEEMLTQCKAPTASPEEKNLIPILEKILSDPIKTKEAGIKFSTDMLRRVSLIDPKLLQERFTQDEYAMMLLSDDVLPGIIEAAMKDDALRDRLETAFGEKLTKGTSIKRIQESFKNMSPVGQLLLIIPLLIIMGGALAFGKAQKS